MSSKFSHGQPWRLEATRTLRYLPRLRLTGRSMAYMPRQSLHPPQRLRQDFLRINSMAHSRIKDKSVNLRCLIFIFLLLTHGVSRALKDTREELRHNPFRRHHGSEMEEKEERFPLVSNSKKHKMENKSKYGDLAIPYTPWPPEFYGSQQITRKRVVLYKCDFFHQLTTKSKTKGTTALKHSEGKAQKRGVQFQKLPDGK